MIRWLIMAPLSLIVSLICYITNPIVVLFCNDAELFHFSYQRYIENCLRDAFDFSGTPIKLVIKQKGEQPKGGF